MMSDAEAWNALVRAAVEWARRMDQFEKFKFDTEFGPVYVSIVLETEHPDSFDLIALPEGDDAEEDRMDRLEEALHRVASWAEAYPLSVFPEPDAIYWHKAHVVLNEHGMPLDRIAAANMRHVVVQIARIARTALEGKP